MNKIYLMCTALVLSTSLHAETSDDSDMGLRKLFGEPEISDTAKSPDVKEKENAPQVTSRSSEPNDKTTAKMERIKADPVRLAKAIERTKARISKAQELLDKNKADQLAIRKERNDLKKDEMDALQKKREQISQGKGILEKRLSILQTASVVSRIIGEPAVNTDEKTGKQVDGFDINKKQVIAD